LAESSRGRISIASGAKTVYDRGWLRQIMQEIQKLRILNKLKSVYRANSVGHRKESAAEHTWSALMLADYYSSVIDQALDRLKVYELLLYHDLVEIEAGDIPLDPNNEVNNQKEIERAAAEVLKQRLPDSLKDKFWELFDEFEQGATLEARFARAIDCLDAMIHELDYRDDWAGWSRTFLITKRERYFDGFPKLLDEFHTLVDYLVEQEYISP
jgi:putative hydrolase of HD superfamily